MSYFNGLILTTKGQEMLLSSNANIDRKITFTNASLGSEKLSPEEIKGATEVKNSWLKFPLNTVRIINDESNYFLRTEIAFTNTGITESKIMRELGIYAKFENEEEVLFAYSTTDDDGETIPKEDIVPATYKFTVDTTISTETKINQTLNPEGFLTKEVIELLKYYIANIAVQRFKSTLTAGQTIIDINSEGSLLTTLSKRLQLFIGGELYSEGIDYTINIENNTIHLKDEFRFEEGTVFEVIDNLPPGYVKELLDEFFKKANEKELEVLRKLETVQTENIEMIKTLSERISNFLDEKNVTLTENLDKKIEEFYLNLDTYIEKNKEKLKGKSLYQSWLDVGNIGSESDFVNAMKIKGDDGDPGKGIVSTTIREGEGRQRIITILYTDDTTNELIVEDGQSAYEVWKSDGNTGTTTDFFKSLEGRGLEYSWRGTELGVRVKGDVEYTFVDLKGDTGGQGPSGGDGPPGKGLYEYWLELGNEGTEEDFVNFFKGVGVVDKEFIKIDDAGNYVYKDVYSNGSKSSEYISPRGPRGYTGGTIGGEPQPPGGYLYGEIRELVNGSLEDGWVYTNGGTISKFKYPQMSTLLPTITGPNEAYFELDENTEYGGSSNGANTWKYPYGGTVKISVENPPTSYYESGAYYIIKNVGGCRYGYSDRYTGMIPKPYILTLPEPLALSFVQINKINTEGSTAVEYAPDRNDNGKKNVDWYMNIEYLDEHGEWNKLKELYNKSDFTPIGGTSVNSIHLFSQTIKSTSFKFSIVDEKSTPNLPNKNSALAQLYFIGKLKLGFDKNMAQLTELLTLPDIKDSNGNYKIIYIGQPLEIQEPGVYSYSKDNIFNGEVPLYLAVENKLPIYSEGITMAEPKEATMGYINKYNNELDIWELVRIHENQAGYYYDKLGDLKYIIKPTNYHIWDFNSNIWIEDAFLKENAKKELLNKRIELEIKKDKMIDLEIDTTFIVEEIEVIKRELEKLNG